MKALTILAASLGFVAVVLSAVLFVKISSLEKRLGDAPTSAEIDDRQRIQEEMHVAYQERAQSLFESLLGIEDRITALETGTSGAAPDGDESVEWQINSLKRDFLAAEGSSSNPDKERILRERMDETVRKLIDRQDRGEGSLESLLLELRLSQDNDWKSYLVREVIWKIPGSCDEQIDFFRNRKNDSYLRSVLAGCAAKHFAGQEELKIFADYLKDPDEELIVKTSIARLFEKMPFSDAEPGLIEGVEGLRIEEGGEVEIVPFSPQHRRACLKALGYHDSPRVTAFLRRHLIELCSPEENEQPEYWDIVFAIHAYETAMGAESVPFLEKLLFDFPGIHEELKKTITGLIDCHKNRDSSEEPDGE